MADEKKGQALEQLSTINGQITRVINTVVSGSKSVSAQNSTVVAGVFGGFSGLSSAYLVTAFVAPLSFTILGPLLTGLGIAAGVLAFRRSATMGAETEAAQRQIAVDENEHIAKTILVRLQKLPRSAPPQIREELWNDYRMVSRELARLAASPAQKMRSPDPQLPSPADLPRPDPPASQSS